MRPLVILAAFALSGCATNFEPKPLPPDHPASAQAQEAPRSGLNHLTASDQLTQTTTAQLARKEAPNPASEGGGMSHDMSPMGGMTDSEPAKSKTAPTIYTCVMHPEIQSDHPGKCPKCGMTLVKKQ